MASRFKPIICALLCAVLVINPSVISADETDITEVSVSENIALQEDASSSEGTDISVPLQEGDEASSLPEAAGASSQIGTLSAEGTDISELSETQNETLPAEAADIAEVQDEALLYAEESSEEDEAQVLAESPGVVTEPTGKKGILAASWLHGVEDPIELGIDHVLFNINLNDVVDPNGTTSFSYGGKTYKFGNSNLAFYRSLLLDLRNQGITITIQINMCWSDDSTVQSYIFPSARQSGHSYYAINTSTSEARKNLAAAFHFLVGYMDFVNNWIVGCEVNSPWMGYYSSVNDISTNTTLAAQAYNIMSDAIKDVNPGAKNYVCLDNIWNFNNGLSIPAKDYLNAFVSKINDKDWNVAYHPYPVPYSSSDDPAQWDLWDKNAAANGYTTHNENTCFITGANIEVLTDYITRNYGTNHRVILSEFGYDARAGEDAQAAELYYTYKAAERNSMIDACIYQPYKDNNWDFRNLGITDTSGNKRKIFNVFKYMDCDPVQAKESYYLSFIGIGSWMEDIIYGRVGYSLFTDVDKNAFYYKPLLWAVEQGITTGTSTYKFSPNTPCLRSQAVTFLWRAAGKPEPERTDNPFTDVKESDFFYKAVLWALDKGITTGTTATTFSPNSPCLRSQIVTFLWRMVTESTPSETENNPFSDVIKDEFYYDAVLWAVENGITTGTSADKFSPNNLCLRGQVVTFLYRTYN